MTMKVNIMNDIKITNYGILFDKIDELVKREKPSIIAIDGMCGSGKSHTADLLISRYECNVFRMDDYFLPLDMRTDKRLSEPGGNVHYERFKEEILDPLKDNKTVIYRPYICGLWKYDEPRTVEFKHLSIIEGSYSMHPYLRETYDLKIFIEVNDEEQLNRISNRKEKNNLQYFIEKWIPMENRYFRELKIKDLSDIVLDTTGI